MLDLLLLPFKLAWSLIVVVFKLVVGAFSLVFGLIGGMIELILSVAVIILIVGLIRIAIQRRKERSAYHESFTSFYDQDGTVE